MDADQDVLRLDIPVNNMLAVQVPQRRRHLGNILSRLPLREAVLPPQVLIQLTLAGELENQEDSLTIMEVAEHLENVGVAKVALDFNLSTDLALNTTDLEFALVQHLQGADESCSALSGKVYSSEFTFAKGTSDFKHAEVELLRDAGLFGQRSLGSFLDAFFR